MRLQRETPFQKKRKSTARNGNEMEMNGMKSNRLNEMEGNISAEIIIQKIFITRDCRFDVDLYLIAK